MDLAAAADALIEAGRRLGARGLISAGEGNLSVRLDADRLLVTPSGLRKDELEPDDLIVVWLEHPDRNAVSRRGLLPTSDLAIHLAVYAARPDLGAVAHAHLPASIALTWRGGADLACAASRPLSFLPRLPFLTIAELGSAELAARIAAALTEPPEPLANAVLLERHGALAVGGDPTAAVDRLEISIVLYRAWRDALLIRNARTGATVERRELRR